MKDALVVGGGPAGAEVARRLARAGRDVVLVEREARAVDKVCGEFLSHEAVSYLEAAGIDLGALGAVPLDTVRIVDREVVAEVRLPFRAASLSRRLLDEALLGRAEALGVHVLRGSGVQSLTHPCERARVRLANGLEIEARTVFVATGKHDVRGHARPNGLQNDLVAFKLHYVLSKANHAAIERCVELILFDGGYAGLQPIENGFANLCLLVRRERLAALGNRFENVVDAITSSSPHFALRLSGASASWRKPLAISSIPYGYVRQDTADAFWLGDQGAVIPSFAGDGISIALHSARLAAETHIGRGPAAAFQRALARDVSSQVLFATALSHGLVHRRAQHALAWAAGRFPRLVSSIAFRTRVSDRALCRMTSLELGAA